MNIEDAILDYCSECEIEITAEELENAVESISADYELTSEYNRRCGIYSVDINILLDSYFF